MKTQSANRGFIYEFLEKDGTTHNKVLVVSSDHRRESNIISILMLGTKYTGKDCIELDAEIEGSDIWYVHCGLVTYTSRSRLGELLGQVSDSVMERITDNMGYQLGITEGIDYKQMYNDLLDRLTKGEV